MASKQDVDDIYDDDDDVTWNETPTDLLSDPAYLNAALEMCQKLDRILTGSDRLTVQTARYTQNAPAWQDGSKIYLEPHQIRTMLANPRDEREVLPTILALNLHEYGHFDWTPRPDNPVWESKKRSTTRNQHQALFHMLNVLEDPRQELLTTMRYPSARDYFRLSTLKSMYSVHKKMGKIPCENFLLYYGRRHMLPRPLLNRLEAELVAKYGQGQVNETKNLIDEYMGISATNDVALGRMWDIADRMNAMYPQPPQTERPSCLTTGHIGAKVAKTAQDKAMAAGKAIMEKADAIGEGAGELPSSQSGDALEQAISDTFGRMAGTLGNRVNEIRSRIYGTAAQKLARLLEEVSTDLKMTEHNRLRRGKLDIKRITQNIANNDPRVFHRRQDDLSPRAKMLIHIMVDVSGSMNDKVAVAMNACRTIARAADLTGHMVKVSTFASGCETNKDWSDEEIKPSYQGGGTNPLPLLSGALADFKKATATYGLQNYALIVITDGEFSDASNCAQALQLMSLAKVHTLLVGINQPVTGYGYGSRYNAANGGYESVPGGTYKADASICIRDVGELENKMRAFLKRLQVDLAREIMRKYGFA